MKINLISTLLFLSFMGINVTINANEVDIVNVKATQQKDKNWRFDVTLKHDDKGWDHYANEWQILTPDNKILGTRTLYHPHVNEQPFTRSLNGIKIPSDIKTVRVIAKDTVHGLSTKVIEINLKTQETKALSLKELKKPMLKK